MQAYIGWLVEQALPTWATVGHDPARGAFRERLDFAGRPLPAPRRAMVQARQIYVYAHAALLGWYPAGGALAEAAMAALRRDYLDESGGRASVAFSVDANGAVVSPVRDSYTHAFLLFALAWLYRLNGDPRLLATAAQVTAFIEESLTDPVHGGLYDAVTVVTGHKRQNPVMHLLEAYLALERAAPGRGYLPRAARLVALFRERLFDAEAGILPELFGEDWSRHADPARIGAFEPGHHFEWMWLLAEYAALTGEDAGPWIAALDRSARSFGLSPAGLVFDEVVAGGRVLKRSHRVWPHTEAIKAAAVRHPDDPAGPADSAWMAERLMTTFLDRPFVGGWIDHVDETGTPLVDHVPASSLYHLFFAAAEAARAIPAVSAKAVPRRLSRMR